MRDYGEEDLANLFIEDRAAFDDLYERPIVERARQMEGC